MAPFNRNSMDFSVHGSSLHGSMTNSHTSSLHGMDESMRGRLSGRSSAKNHLGHSSVHGRSVPLKDALDLSLHGLRPALDLTCHSTCHPQQNEFDAIMAVIEESKNGVDLDEIMSLFEEKKADLPPFVVDFVEQRLGRFQRNVGLVQETFQEEMGDFLEALGDEDEDPGEVVKDFVQARFSIFARNMATIGILLTEPQTYSNSSA